MDGAFFLTLVCLAQRSHERALKPILQEYGLRQSDLDVLMCAAASGSCLTARTIADSRLLAKSLVSTSVDALMRRGLLAGETDPQDRRRVLLKLQPAAREIVDRAEKASQAFLEQLLSGASEEDVQAARRVCDIICRNLNAQP